MKRRKEQKRRIATLRSKITYGGKGENTRGTQSGTPGFVLKALSRFKSIKSAREKSRSLRRKERPWIKRKLNLQKNKKINFRVSVPSVSLRQVKISWAWPKLKRGRKIVAIKKRSIPRPQRVTKARSWKIVSPVSVWFNRRVAPAGMVMMYAVMILCVLLTTAVPSGIVNAGSTPYDFSAPASYTVGDATKVEVASNKTQLKNQQNTTDGNTAGYWRFDETSGNAGDDQSVNNNDVSFSTTTPCAGATWGPGKIAADGVDVATYGATTLGGAIGCVSATDSASLSLSSQVTLEAYLKFTNAFDQTNTITQGILDKGNYRMYFDESDGKLKFELDDNATKTWNKVGGSSLTPTTPGINGNEGLNGSWRQAVPHTIWAIQEFNNELFVGTYGSGTDMGTGEVWKYSGSNQTWTKVGGNETGSTNWDARSTEGVFSMAVHSNALYAGIGMSAGDAEVWRYSGSGTTWTRVAGGAVNGSWSLANNIEAVFSLVSDGTYLYAGTGSTSSGASQADADVWRCADCGTTPAWTIIGGTHNTTGANINSSWGAWVSLTNAHESVRSMVVMGGNLYVGLGDTAAANYADADLWRWNGSAWAKVGGDGTLYNGTGWAANTFEYVFSLATDGTTLYAGLGATASDADVWACTNCGTSPSWAQIGGNEAHASKSNWNLNYEFVRSLVYQGGKLYASLGDTANEAEVWRYDTTSWTKVGGDGVNSTWDASFTTPASTTNTKEYAFLGTFGSALVTGTGATPQDAEVWTCASCDTAPSWSWIGGRDFRSWGSANLSWVTSMAVNAGKLYVGTGAGANVPSYNKNATIWEYNGSTWSQVGGGNLGLAAGEYWENYEYVLSMASYKGYLYAGFGNTADDSDVWKYDSGSWTQVGGTTVAGATVNSSWTDANNIEEVTSMVADETYLYVGTGVTATDGDVWRFDGNTWGGLPIGGSRNDTNVLVNNSWAAGTYERVQSLKIANGLLFAGLGSTAGDAEVWRFYDSDANGTLDTWGPNASPNTIRNRIGGDGDASFTTTWNRSDGTPDVFRESIRSMTFIDGTMFVALGDTNDANGADAEIWSCTNCLDTTINAYTATKPNWTKIAGDGVNGSWDNLVYEQVTSIVGYKGHLFATLGINNTGTDYDAEMWEYNGSTWAKVGGDGQTEDTWGGNYEVAGELIVLNGRLYVGLGTTTNNGTASDAEVWEYGANTSKVVASTTASWTAGRWYHVAGTYDGTNAKVFVCDSTNLAACTGTPETTSAFGAMTLADNNIALAVGYLHGALGPDRSYGGFTGNLDEVRISNTARTSFNYSQYTPIVQTVQPAVAISRSQKHSWSGFEATDNGVGTITYRLSDNGVTWKYWLDTAWVTSSSTSQASTEAVVNANIHDLPVTSSGMLWQAVLSGNGDQQVILNSVTVNYIDDTEEPNNITSVVGNSGNWFDRSGPAFSWSAPSDPLPDPNPNSEQASGIEGYYVYFGKDGNFVPSSNPALFQTGTTYTASAIPSGDTDPYYLRIQTRDYAQNVSTTVYDQFRDTTNPANVDTVSSTVNSGQWFNRLNPSFTWTPPTDSAGPGEIASGIKGYYVYFGTNLDAVPSTDSAGVFRTTADYTAPPIDPSDTRTYYFRIQTQDKALRTNPAIYDAFRDETDPSPVTSVTGNANGGSWFDRTDPQFSWSTATDGTPGVGEKASGVDGYYVYFGPSASAVPADVGTLVSGTSYIASRVPNGNNDPYYFRIQSRDRAFNTSTIFDPFRDTKAPNNVTAVTALSGAGGSPILANTWYRYDTPEFSWTAPTDDVPDPNSGNELASGVAGYYVYFGPSAEAIPRVSGTFQTANSYSPSNLTSGETYYLRIQTRDLAFNTTGDIGGILVAFTYKVDKVGPSGPTVSVSPAGYTAVNSFTFFWLGTGPGAAVDPGAPTNGSGFSGNYVYRVGSGDWSAPTLDTNVTIASAAYQEGANVFEIKAIDNVGNEGPATSVTFYYAGSAPTAPENLQVSPSSSSSSPSTDNAFSFTWGPPASSISPIKQYRFSVNKLPTAANTTITPFTSLAAAPYATQQGKNTFYVVAQDEAGNINYDNPAQVSFYTLTPAPAAPASVQIFDISNRDTEEYAISMKWSEPTKGNGFDGYEVYRSADGSTFVSAGTTKSPVFIDTNLTSAKYYYKVKSKDNAGQFSADSTTTDMTPTGRYTTPPALTDGPTVVPKSFSATITWDTDRIGSSFIEYGPDRYHLGTQQGGVTVGTLDLMTKHTVTLNGLQPETTYAYQAVWVDQDGNRGQSDVLSFPTGLRPKISDVKISNIALSSADISWVSTTVATSLINYGKTRSYGASVNDVSGSQTTKHTMRIENLEDATTYYFVITGKDVDDNALSSDEYSFTTLTRPRITNFKYEPVKDSPTTAIRFSWTTNVPTTTIINYGQAAQPTRTKSEAEYATAHEILVDRLSDNTAYSIQARGVDRYGNTAQSESSRFTTPNDSRPPRVLNLSIEVRATGVGQTQKAQLVVSWETDEPGTSQVEYGPGISSDSYPSRTQEDPALGTTHVVIVPELEPAKLYHLRAVSRDQASNPGTSSDTTAITGKMQRSVIDIIMGSLQRSLGFLSVIPGM